MRFVRFQILMWEPQRIWLKLLVLSGLYALLENKRTQNENEIRLERLIQAKKLLESAYLLSPDKLRLDFRRHYRQIFRHSR